MENNYNGWDTSIIRKLHTQKPHSKSNISSFSDYSNTPFCFICEHCHKLVIVDNPSKYVGHTLRCECGHMYTMLMHTYYIEQSYNPYYDDYGDCDKYTAPAIEEVNIPKRNVFNATCIPIILNNGDHYVGTNALSNVDVGYMIKSLINKEQFNIIVKTIGVYTNARELVAAFKAHNDAVKKAIAEKRAARFKKFMTPWNVCCKAIGNFFLSMSNVGN